MPDEVDAYIEHKASGRRVKLHRKGKVIMRARGMPDEHVQQKTGAMGCRLDVQVGFRKAGGLEGATRTSVRPQKNATEGKRVEVCPAEFAGYRKDSA